MNELLILSIANNGTGVTNIGTGVTQNYELVEYVGIFNTESELSDLVVLQTSIAFVLLFTLIMAKLFINKTRS